MASSFNGVDCEKIWRSQKNYYADFGLNIIDTGRNLAARAPPVCFKFNIEICLEVLRSKYYYHSLEHTIHPELKGSR